MIYELRIYHAMPGKLTALNKRFETTTCKFFEKHGIRAIGFWTPVIGDHNNDLYFILEWKDLAEREQRWNAFQADPEWIQRRAESEADGPLYHHITNLILTPTAYSKMR
ncbi:MAG: NIPSNAP family protein [Chloroflexi bacterium]|nr:NIPSNAP family protein [Chloroflexota bacterium]